MHENAALLKLYGALGRRGEKEGNRGAIFNYSRFPLSQGYVSFGYIYVFILAVPAAFPLGLHGAGRFFFSSATQTRLLISPVSFLFNDRETGFSFSRTRGLP